MSSEMERTGPDVQGFVDFILTVLGGRGWDSAGQWHDLVSKFALGCCAESGLKRQTLMWESDMRPLGGPGVYCHWTGP